MGNFLFGFVVGANLTWLFTSLCGGSYWREFNARRRGSNPPSPGRKPAPPVGPPSDVAAAINSQLDRDIAIARRKRGLSPYGWGPHQLNPPPPAPGMLREYLWSPTRMAECGGPCWEAQDPRRCDCGAMWRDVPIRMEEGRTQRGNGSGGPTTPKPPIKPQPAGGRMIDQSGMTIGYQPLPWSGRTTTPPPREP
jgi:hypothetical protein